MPKLTFKTKLSLKACTFREYGNNFPRFTEIKFQITLICYSDFISYNIGINVITVYSSEEDNNDA